MDAGSARKWMLVKQGKGFGLSKKMGAPGLDFQTWESTNPNEPRSDPHSFLAPFFPFPLHNDKQRLENSRGVKLKAGRAERHGAKR
jgi:hypothetical protein